MYVVPFLKLEKSSLFLESFRPLSLISCMGKTVEMHGRTADFDADKSIPRSLRKVSMTMGSACNCS